jgi:ribose 5-phosphate isomerase B
VKIAFGSDEVTSLTDAVRADLEHRGHEVIAVGPPADEAGEWAEVGRRVGHLVVVGEADTGVLFCWTGTGASIAANKVHGVRAALCADAETARGARKWNDANVLALSLRGTSAAVLDEILDAWFEAQPSGEPDDVENIRHVDEISG